MYPRQPDNNKNPHDLDQSLITLPHHPNHTHTHKPQSSSHCPSPPPFSQPLGCQFPPLSRSPHQISLRPYRLPATPLQTINNSPQCRLAKLVSPPQWSSVARTGEKMLLSGNNMSSISITQSKQSTDNTTSGRATDQRQRGGGAGQSGQPRRVTTTVAGVAGATSRRSPRMDRTKMGKDTEVGDFASCVDCGGEGVDW